MTLEQAAKQAMDYLDSVGVTAEYDIKTHDSYNADSLTVTTDDYLIVIMSSANELTYQAFMNRIKIEYPTKSPVK